MRRLLVVLGRRDASVNHTDEIYLRVTTIIERAISLYAISRGAHDDICACLRTANNATCRARARLCYSRNKKGSHSLRRRDEDFICEKQGENEKLATRVVTPSAMKIIREAGGEKKKIVEAALVTQVKFARLI